MAVFAKRIPLRFRDATMATLDKKQMASVLAYAKDIPARMKKGMGLLLFGAPGLGKTWAVSALTQAYVTAMAKASSRVPDYEFVTAPDLFENLGDFGEKVDEYRGRKWTDTYTKVPWLVLNDLGKEYRGGKMAQTIPHLLGRILRARSENRLVTHITTNLNGEGMTKTYGESIVSLMAETLDFVQVTGKDRRFSR